MRNLSSVPPTCYDGRMAEITPQGLCVMGCGRLGTHRNKMYCVRCYDTMRRGGFDKKPVRTEVKAVLNPDGSVRRKGYVRTQWKSDPKAAEFLTARQVRDLTDKRPRCAVRGCKNLARHNADKTCDRHNEKAAKRVQRYREEGRIKEYNRNYRRKVARRRGLVRVA